MLRLGDTCTAQGRHQAEVVIAFARAMLAAVLLFAITLPAKWPPGFDAGTTGVHVVFAAYCVALLLLIRSGHSCTPNFIRTVHLGDIVWPAALSFITSGLDSPYLILFVFALFAAAYRWNIWTTLITTASVCIALLAEAAWIVHISGPQRIVTNSIALRVCLQAGFLVVTGVFFAFFKEVQNRRANEQAALLRLVESSRAATTVKAVIEKIVSRLGFMLGATRATFSFESEPLNSVCVWDEAHDPNASTDGEVKWLETSNGAYSLSFLPPDGAVHLCRAKDGKLWARIFKPSGSIERVSVPESESLTTNSFDDALVARLGTDNWSGSLFLETTPDPWFDSRLPFLQTALEHIVTAIDHAYLTDVIRQKAGAMERIQLGRELHDGVMQSLFGLEMQLFLVRRFADESELRNKLEEMQTIVHDQLLELRDMVQEIRTTDVNAEGLQEFIANAVDKFARESGIAAHFADDTPPGGCRGLSDTSCQAVARIVHEALVNARKHSRARAVLVRLGVVDERIRLTIEDNGRGCKFQGQLSLAELEANHSGPVVIKAAARAIGADLFIESYSWRGTKIEVDLPREAHYAATAL